MNLAGSSHRCGHCPQWSLWEMTGISALSPCFSHPDPKGQSGNPAVRPLSQTSGVCPTPAGGHWSHPVLSCQSSHRGAAFCSPGGCSILAARTRGWDPALWAVWGGLAPSKPSPGQRVPSGCQKECSGAGQLWGWGF
ncbi:hypothetical protein mRhiFer1_008230 [Rhinolophus ferrumequinum]|uniref:Uncharacterized protein n=1 Tax=Rhinolophus ferrumequinum TaxID=59479 RepID=A0A7J7W7R3_RHIFE|nr:hypothetical protein mRhiFer1_008230 [Rhinolophus ferrumequinum]